MSVYAIGDIHGCYGAFRRLLSRLRFNKRKDRLWLVGDLVNRGEDSASVLRWARAHDDCVTAVLGNHDLHLLAIAGGHAKAGEKDNFADLLAAPDAADLLAWLRRRPLAHYENAHLLVHAGVLPSWDAATTIRLATSAAAIISGEDWGEFALRMRGDEPAQWRDSLVGAARLRVVVNALTRMRVCDADGRMLMAFKGAPADIPAGYAPWFDAPARRAADVKIICGHWSALGLIVRGNLLALDTGCFWGGSLTAVRLDDGKIFQASAR